MNKLNKLQTRLSKWFTPSFNHLIFILFYSCIEPVQRYYFIFKDTIATIQNLNGKRFENLYSPHLINSGVLRIPNITAADEILTHVPPPNWKNWCGNILTQQPALNVSRVAVVKDGHKVTFLVVWRLLGNICS